MTFSFSQSLGWVKTNKQTCFFYLDLQKKNPQNSLQIVLCCPKYPPTPHFHERERRGLVKTDQFPFCHSLVESLFSGLFFKKNIFSISYRF
jgi:hypothetical protein